METGSPRPDENDIGPGPITREIGLTEKNCFDCVLVEEKRGRAQTFPSGFSLTSIDASGMGVIHIAGIRAYQLRGKPITRELILVGQGFRL